MKNDRLIGMSREGRPLQSWAFPASPALAARRRLLIFGGIHGDEPSSAEAVEALRQRLSAAGSALTGASVWLVPAVNPDGLAAGQKNSASDVDLNRNFPAANFERAHAPGYDPGPAPLSEPETAALARFIDEAAIDAVVAVHAPFACVNFDGPAADWAAAVAQASGWPVRASIGYPTPGSFGSWLGIDRGLPILTLELPPGPLERFRAQADAALDRAVAYWNDAQRDNNC
jgi:protein MpaA